MPWSTKKLNDGRQLPEIAFGSWKVPVAECAEEVEQAYETAFDHYDTAQIYRNEKEVGEGLKLSTASRSDFWLTSKWSGMDGKGPAESIRDSLRYLDVKALDLYLIHSPRLTNGDPAGSWTEMEKIQKEGLSTSIGVSNFKVADLEAIRHAGLSTPAINQILLHPYVYKETVPLLAYHAAWNITTEAYSVLSPITSQPGGPLDKPLKDIAKAHTHKLNEEMMKKKKKHHKGEKHGHHHEHEHIDVNEGMILFAWARAKGAVVITTSSKKERLLQYRAAGDIQLSQEEVDRIDDAGSRFASWQRWQKAQKAVVWATALAGMWAVKTVLENK